MNRILDDRMVKGAPGPGEFCRFKEIIDRPMGTVTACGMLVSNPPDVRNVAGLLLDRNTRISTRAAWVLGNAAAKRVDISEACEELELALSDCERDMRLAGGYALTMHYINRSPGGPFPLASHEDEAVRHGANIALNDRGREF